MAAEVSSFSRMAKVCMEEAEKGTELVTRDLLGSAAAASLEVDLELQVPAGWESYLDLLSGNSYLQLRVGRLLSSESTCGRPAMAVIACPPGCLVYMFICNADPRCPKCGQRADQSPQQEAAD